MRFWDTLWAQEATVSESNMSQGSAADPRGEQVVHVRGDSDSDLDALFQVLKNAQPNQVPLSKRKLPASFFKPPEPRSANHSREGSLDGSQLGPPPGLPIAHGRSLSSPAQLAHSQLSVAPPPPLHMKQASVPDYTDELVPLPAGWEMAKTPDGQRYYLK